MEAASLLALAWLIGERALAHSPALQQAVDGTHGLARLGTGALLLAALLAAALQWLLPGLSGLSAQLIGAGLSLIAASMLLQRRYRHAALAVPERLFVAGFLLVLLLSLVGLCMHQAASTASITQQLWQVLALVLALSLGLPAFVALAQRLDDRAVPGLMRPLPARLLATAVLALSLGGLQRELGGLA